MGVENSGDFVEQTSRLDLDKYSIIIERQKIEYANDEPEKKSDDISSSSAKYIKGKNGFLSRQLTIFTSLDVINENENNDANNTKMEIEAKENISNLI
jgi:hypothetical protein